MNTSQLFSLKGRVAVITGGNGGLGLAMAKAISSMGAAVVIVGQKKDKTLAAQQVLREKGGEVLALIVDLTESTAIEYVVKNVIEAFGRVDVLINNAGISVRGPCESISLPDYERVLQLNLTVPMKMSQQIHGIMASCGGGKIINICSLFSHLGSSFSMPYAVSKGGLVQLTRSLSVAWASDNIQVNAILPGWFDTELTRYTREIIPGLHEKVERQTPVSRWGKPEDIGGAAVFLASSASDFITGAVLVVDGGFLVNV